MIVFPLARKRQQEIEAELQLFFLHKPCLTKPSGTEPLPEEIMSQAVRIYRNGKLVRDLATDPEVLKRIQMWEELEECRVAELQELERDRNEPYLRITDASANSS